MIRREENGQYLLIRQDDHAHLSRTLAEQIGNGSFQSIASSERGQAALVGIGLHDEGWPLHDDAPTLNPRGLPRDVFESRIEVLPVWAESARRASEADPYAGLLVSLHVLALSAIALTDVLHQYSRQNLAYTRDRFELNKFQHGQIELQQSLRAKLGLRMDLPLHYGLAEAGVEAAEDLLAYHFRTLQAMDRLSLALCCTKPPFDTVDLFAHPGAKPTKVRLNRSGTTLKLDPWPFATATIQLHIPARPVPLGSYPSEGDLAAAIKASNPVSLPLSLISGHP